MSRVERVDRVGCDGVWGGPGAVPATVACCFRYWEKGSSGEGEFFAIYIFISDIDAQLAFVSFTKGQRRRGGPAALRWSNVRLFR